ncbi:MAG: NfeD family protein [Anaerolineales bacterium]
MEFLHDPNVAYTLLVTGILLGLLALVTPGTGALEIGALFAFTIAAYGAYNLEINPWALVVLVLALVPFLYSLRLPKWRMALLGATVLLVVVGSVFMFVGENGWPAVNPIVATVVSLMYGGFLYFAIDRSIAAMQARPTHDLNALVGQIGEAKTKVHDNGSVQIAGELWSARSERAIPVGTTIRVVKREGFVLLVEKHS